MDERLKESISALMDDEVNELELQRVLSHVDQDQLSETWQRYHLMRSVMQNDHAIQNEELGCIDIDVSASVSKLLENEEDSPALERDHARQSDVPVSSLSDGSYGRVGGLLAVAASVVFAVIFVFQNGVGSSSVESDLPIAQSNTVPNQANDGGLVVVENTVGENTVVEKNVVAANAEGRYPVIVEEYSQEQKQRLNEYLLRHAEHSMFGSRTGAMPFVRVASVNSVGI